MAPKIVTNRFFLPPTSSRTIDSAPLEDVLFMRDEMANLAWAIERIVESPIEEPAQRYEAPDAVPSPSLGDSTNTDLPRYLLSSQVPPNWIPLLPVQLQNPLHPNTPRQILSRLKRGAVLQPDAKRKVHDAATGEVLLSLANLLLYDEESRAKAPISLGSADWRAGRTPRRTSGRRSGIKSARAKARAICSSINCWSRVAVQGHSRHSRNRWCSSGVERR